MTTMLLDISKTIERSIATVLTDLAGLADTHDIEFLVVGAAARDMILGYGFGIEVRRATRDIDFGIRVADWDEFECLVGLLENNNWHCPEQPKHRFLHQTGVPIDLIPFGAIETESGEIRWPPDFNEVMSVIGFADAYADSWQTQIAALPPVQVAVASPAGQALLKMVAWRDRGSVRGGPDATDLRLLMERYLDLDNVARVAEQFPEWLDEDFDYLLTSARLLGADVRRCVDSVPSNTFNSLVDTLRPDRIERSLAYAMHRISEDADLLYCQRLVDAFCSEIGNHGR